MKLIAIICAGMIASAAFATPTAAQRSAVVGALATAHSVRHRYDRN